MVRLLYSLALCLLVTASGVEPPKDEPHPLTRVQDKEIPKRVESFSALFLGRPYAFNGGLGEGATGEFDRNPMVRFDEFHCVTYLETVIALSISKTQAQFERNLRRIRYKNGKVSFETRNHFPCLDWIPNNIRNGVLQDITAQVAGEFPLAVAKSTIDRKGWFEFMQENRIILPEADENVRHKALDKLHALGKKYKEKEGTVSYIPFRALFPQTTPEGTPLDNQVPANEPLFRRIPSGAIVNMVRPNWNVLKVIGTRMNVSHQGFLIWKGDTLYLRHAKMEPAKKIVDEPFVDYLRRAMTIKSIQGIHLLQVRDLTPVNSLATKPK